MEKWAEWALGIALTLAIGLGVYKALPTPVQNTITTTVNTQLSQLP